MIKEIKYNGYTANPSDYDCPDGDLATSIGTVLEDGALHPSCSQVSYTIPSMRSTDTAQCCTSTKPPVPGSISSSEAMPSMPKPPTSSTDIPSIHSPEKILSRSRQSETHSSYLPIKLCITFCGSPPAVSMEVICISVPRYPNVPYPSVCREKMIRSDVFTISFDSMRVPGKGFSESNKVKITEQVSLAKVNKFIAEESTK